MPRRIFPAGSATNATGNPLRLTFHTDASTGRRETDLWTVDGSNNLSDRIPNGILLTDSSGNYSAFAGPDDADTLYRVDHVSGVRTAITATGYVASSSLSITYAHAAAAGPVVPLSLPTYDGNPSVGHPSVKFFPGGWNGYTHWMAFTPYPTDPRENPSILASRDGQTWVVPSGLTNPVVPQAEATAAGYFAGSDTSLLPLADGSLAMYYRMLVGSTKNSIWRKTSTDGVHWSSGVKVAEDLASDLTMLSPAFVREDDGTIYMWSVNYAASPHPTVERRTSSDGGVTFGVASTCTIQRNDYANAWHVDVVKAGGMYHMLLSRRPVSSGPYRLHYMTSTDGLTFAQANPGGSIPLTGMSFDVSGHYRSCLVPVSGDPLRFDVYITGLIAGTGNSVYASDSTWRIALLRNVDLTRAGAYEPYQGQIWVPATAWGESALGTPSRGTLASGRYTAWLLDQASNEAVSASVRVPSDWARVSFDLYWSNTVATSGDVCWQLRHPTITGDGFNLDVQPSSVNLTATAPAVNILKISEIGYGEPVTGGSVSLLRITRDASNAADTLAGDAALLGVMIRKVG